MKFDAPKVNIIFKLIWNPKLKGIGLIRAELGEERQKWETIDRGREDRAP